MEDELGYTFGYYEPAPVEPMPPEKGTDDWLDRLFDYPGEHERWIWDLERWKRRRDRWLRLPQDARERDRERWERRHDRPAPTRRADDEETGLRSLVAARLRAARAFARLTQSEVADRLEVSRTRISRIESADRPVRVDELVRLAAVLETSVEELTDQAVRGSGRSGSIP